MWTDEHRRQNAIQEEEWAKKRAERLDLYRQGYSMKEIARLTHCSKTVISRLVSNYISVEEGKKREEAYQLRRKALIEERLAYYNAGWSYQDIADTQQVTVNAVKRSLREALNALGIHERLRRGNG